MGWKESSGPCGGRHTGVSPGSPRTCTAAQLPCEPCLHQALRTSYGTGSDRSRPHENTKPSTPGGEIRFPVPRNLCAFPYGFPSLPQKQALRGKTAQGSGDRMAIYSPSRGVLEGSRPATPGSRASASETSRKKFIHVARAAWFVVFGSGRPSMDSGLGQSRPCLTLNLQGPWGQAATALVFLLQGHDGTDEPQQFWTRATGSGQWS